jgi:hypothetical protein
MSDKIHYCLRCRNNPQTTRVSLPLCDPCFNLECAELLKWKGITVVIKVVK